MIGPSVGRLTMTLKAQPLLLPHASCTLMTTGVVVLGRNAVPKGGEEVTVTLPHGSTAYISVAGGA